MLIWDSLSMTTPVTPALPEMMEMRAQHARAGGVSRRQQLALQRGRVGQAGGGHAVEIGQHMAAGRGVDRHLCDPLDQPVLLEEPPPQVLPLVPVPPARPGALAPVVASTTITA